MKVKARKLLSLLLTLAMVAGMFVLPASAEEPADGVYAVDFGDIATGKTVTKGGTNDYFSWAFGSKSNDTISADSGTWTDGYQSTNAFRTDGASDASARIIKFTTKYANAAVKVWFRNGSSGDRNVILKSGSWSGTEIGKKAANASRETAEFTATTAGDYVLGGDAAIRIHKVQVTENLPKYSVTANGSIENGTVKFKVGGDEPADSIQATAGTTVTVIATGTGDYVVDTISTDDADTTVSADGTFTMPAKAVVVTATFKTVTPQEIIDSVKAELTSDVLTYTIADTDANEEATVQNNVEEKITAALTEASLNDKVTVTVTKTSFTAAVAGTDEAPAGTNGSYAYKVKLEKNGTSDETLTGTVTITATPADIDKTALTAAITAADNVKSRVVTTGAAADYFATVKLASTDAVNALDAAIAAAQGKVDSTATTAAQVTEAVETLDAAVGTFKDSLTAGTKAVPTTVKTYTLEGQDISKSIAGAVVAGVGTDGIFSVHGSSSAKMDTSSGKKFDDNGTEYTAPGNHRINLGGALEVADGLAKDGIGFVTAGPATVKIFWIVATEANREMKIVDATGAQQAKTNEQAAKDSLHVSTLELSKAGTYFLGGDPNKNYVFKVEVTTKEVATLMKMKDAGTAQQSAVYYPGIRLEAQAKAVDAVTGKDIPGVKYTYSSTYSADGTGYTADKPFIDHADIVTYFYKAEAEGYEPFISTVGRNMTISRANPVLAIKAEPNLFHTAVPAERITTLTVTCNIAGADVDQVTVTGKDETTGTALPKSKIEKVDGKKGVYTVYFNEPDTKVVYVFTASFPGNANYNKAEDQTARVTVINHEISVDTYKLTYNKNEIKIKYTSAGSTDDAVLEGAGVEAEAIIPEGKEFKCWSSDDLDPTDADWATQNPTKFAMPGHDVELKVEFKDKTETETVNKTALVGLLRTAEGWRDLPVVATDAAKVDKDVDWVKQDDLDTFQTAIDTAQAVSSNAKATQADVDKAVNDLDAAITAFKATWGKGTKTESGSEGTTYSLTAAEVYKYLQEQGKTDDGNGKIVMENGTPIANQGTNGIFTVYPKKSGTSAGSIDNNSRKWDDLTDEEETKRFNFGGNSMTMENGEANVGCVIQFTTNKTSTVKVWWGTNTANAVALYVADSATPKYTSEKVTVDKTVSYTSTIAAVEAGTYYLGGTVDGAKGNFYPVKIEVIEGGSETPDTPDTSAARAALKEAVEAAQKLLDETKDSVDGSNISKDEQWVTAAAKTAYQNAIELAEAKANSPRLDNDALAAAKADLEKATNVFEAAKRDGTKTSSSSGGGSSNVPSSGGGSTVTNADGSKTTTKTNKTTGTVTETTTWPNGDKQVVVTEKDGTVTETLTKKDGTKTETVTKPDGSTTTAVTDAKGIKTETAVSASGETSAKVTLPKHIDKTVVTIPVKDATDGTVAVIVDAKGNETVIKTAIATENGLDLLVTGNVSVKIKDNAKKFNDIADDYWAKGAVDFVSSREIFKGTTDVTFAPIELVNRGMMATVLYRLADAKAEGENVFFDVADSTWYTDAVVWANRSGVVNGYADGTFGPADAVTREQMAAMLFRYAKAMGMDISAKGDMSKFGDANDVSSWASEAMTWCVGVGLINGVADPATGVTLSPAKTASRAEVATIMQRMVKLMMQ